MNYFLHLGIMISIYIILSLSLNLTVGYLGLLGLGLSIAAFYGIGAYTTALLMINFGVNFFIALALAVIISATLSICVSYPSTRLKKDYFILSCLSFQIIIFTILYNSEFTRGAYGIAGIPRPEFFGIIFDDLYKFFALSAGIAILIAFLLRRIYNSSFGLALKAIREDELAAISLGKNISRFKILSICISSGLAAIAGGLYASYVSFIDPTSFNLDESIYILLILLFSGTGNIKAPVVGSLTMILLPEFLRFLSIPESVAANMRLIIYALILIILMRYRSQGIMGEYQIE